MQSNLIVIDDFYSNPHEVRDHALSQDFHVEGNYPGKRTNSFLSSEIKKAIQYYLPELVKDWNDYDTTSYSGAYQICTSRERTWIHTDSYNNWAGVLYLTPDAPVSGGTAFYKHRASNDVYTVEGDHGYDSQDYTKWEQVDFVGNVFNRLVLFNSKRYHASVDYFGKDLNDGRLIQVFFLST